ncbi:MAG: AAA family ATPase [Epulopiscium sp. Nuni2H_MBin003]|nr:MAG: AAA family ATPase [Epulopiscium sp. Nuni2H_MBin003]
MVIEGVIENIIYQNAENGYTVCSVISKGEEIACVGNLLGVHPGEDVEIEGEYITHHVYGRQLKITSFSKSMPKSTYGIERYLGSGVIKGIGQKTAKKIVDHFKMDTLNIIEHNPIMLANISGISKNKAIAIGEKYKMQYELRSVMIALAEYGITTNAAIKIHDMYQQNTMQIIKSNPYKLASDMHGIGFKRADEIAVKVGIEREDINRIKAGILFVLNEFSTNGHTYAPRDALFNQAYELLGVDITLLENALIEINIDKQVIIKTYDGQVAVFLRKLYYSELNIADKLLTLSYHNKQEPIEFENEIKQTQRELDITLVKEQQDAIKNALVNGVTVITGGPGTGKTTTINALIHMIKKKKEEFLLTAPTGRAAKRMSEATNEEAKTIHRLLEITYNKDANVKQYFNRDKDNPLETDILIVDEMSMIDVYLMEALLEALVTGQRIVLIGDIDQLPSVGAGNVLHDIIESKRVKVVKLVQIFRQASKSAIIRNAHRINKGEYPVSNEEGTDFFFMNRVIQDEVKNTIVDLITTRLPKKYGNLDNLKDIQVLAPMRKGVLGITELNKVLQQALNPPNDLKNEYEYRQIIFRTNDKVMQIKNNYNIPWKVYGMAGMPIDDGIGIYNGDCGVITDITSEKLIVTFDDYKVVEYEFNQLEELELAYAVTIHKSQGSEYAVVIIPVHSGPPMLLSRNLLYTAVTRAKQMVIIVGINETVNRMIDNNKQVERYTNLARHLQNIM